MSQHVGLWPNLTYWLVHGLRAARLMPQPSAAYQRKMRIYWGMPTADDLAAEETER